MALQILSVDGDAGMLTENPSIVYKKYRSSFTISNIHAMKTMQQR